MGEKGPAGTSGTDGDAGTSDVDPEENPSSVDAADSGPDAPSVLGVEVDPDADGPAAFMQALQVPRNAKVGAIVGSGFALLVFVFFVVIPGTYRQPLWYVGLGFVLALSTAGLVATLLTLGRAVRLSRNLWPDR